MATLTGTHHGDAANELLGFYREKAEALEVAGEYFMSAIALAFALETAVLAYLLVEFGDENGGELRIKSSVNLSGLIDAANEIGILSAPIDGSSRIQIYSDENIDAPRHVAEEVIDKIRRFRNLIHPARALKEAYNPRAFTVDNLNEFKDMFDSVMHSLLYHL